MCFLFVSQAVLFLLRAAVSVCHSVFFSFLLCNLGVLLPRVQSTKSQSDEIFPLVKHQYMS